MIKIGMMIGDRYEILEKIGTGGMSDVYKAKCHKLNRFVAVKVLKQEFSENANFVSKFQVEAQAAAGLMHPNIVNVYDVGEDNGIYYIVMELVEGITLKKYIEKKARLSVKEAVSIAIQVSMGIEAAHNNHIIHRDIKPQNIIISKEGKVKVTDFGIAKAATSNTITSNVMGSVHYTSPEQARGGYSDAKSDIYSLGITMFEMLTGRVPFNGDTTVAIAIKHIQDEMPSPREFVVEIPISVEQIVFKCTQKSPDRRYQTMGELIYDLKRSLINPDEDFVKVIDLDEKEETKLLSDSDIDNIKRRSGRNADEGLRLNTPYEEEDDDEDDGYYEDEDYEGDEDDDEDNGEGTGMEKLTTVLAIIAAVVIGAAILIFAATKVGILNLGGDEASTQEATDVEMVDVVGKKLADVTAALDKVGLQYETEFEESDKYDENIVMESSVAAGEVVNTGDTTVKLTVSSGTQGIEVPNVVDKSMAEATAALEADGFKVTKDTSYSDSVEKGNVISQSPTAGSKATSGTAVSIVISNGKESSSVPMPDLRGMTESAAKTALTNAKLACGTVSETNSDNVTTGCVVTQSYSPGVSVDEGTKVDITLSIGPKSSTYSCNISVNAPSDYQSGNASIVLFADSGTQLFSTTASSFPVAINLSGIKDSASGKVVVTYTVSTETQSTDADGNVTTQTVEENKTQEQAVSFTKE